VHLVGLIIRICHDARSPEFYPKNKFEKLVHLVGFIIRIIFAMYNIGTEDDTMYQNM